MNSHPAHNPGQRLASPSGEEREQLHARLASSPVVLLDRDKNRSYKRCAMMRGARVALVVVVVFSIAYVLISPDLTDDFDGVLRSNHSAKAQRLASLSVTQPQILVIVGFLLSKPPSSPQRLTASELLDLVCVCRC